MVVVKLDKVVTQRQEELEVSPGSLSDRSAKLPSLTNPDSLSRLDQNSPFLARDEALPANLSLVNER